MLAAKIKPNLKPQEGFFLISMSNRDDKKFLLAIINSEHSV